MQIMVDQKQLENVEYFNSLGSMITNDARCAHDVTARIAMAKITFNNNYKNLFTSNGKGKGSPYNRLLRPLGRVQV